MEYCPVCRSPRLDNKLRRTAIYIKDVRVAIFPPGTINTQKLNEIVKGTPDSYLMIEVLDENGRIMYSRQAGESKFIEVNGHYVKREKTT